MPTLIYAYIIGSSIVLLLLLFLVFQMQGSVSEMKELLSSLRDKWAQTEGRTRKIEKAVDWFLERNGLKLDRSNISWDWNIMPIQQGHELDEWWKQIQRHREEIVYALYESTKSALDDHDKEKNKKDKKGKKKK